VSRLTEEGYWVSSPRFDLTGRRLTYFLRDPHGFPAIREIALDGEGRRGAAPPASRRVVDRSGGRILSVNGGQVYFDEIDLADNVAMRSDIWAADASTGRRQRLTRDARLLEPDVSADGRQLACVRVEDDGTRSLAVYDVTRREDGRLELVPAALPIRRETGETFGAPRWSPDGRWIVAERRREGGRSEVIVIGIEDGATRVVAAAVHGRVMTPDWMPGG
jgi:Tol biopolymer transport system component